MVKPGQRPVLRVDDALQSLAQGSASVVVQVDAVEATLNENLALIYEPISMTINVHQVSDIFCTRATGTSAAVCS
jgi:hypothetical protein